MKKRLLFIFCVCVILDWYIKHNVVTRAPGAGTMIATAKAS